MADDEIAGSERRDFLYMVTGSFAVFGVSVAAWPFLAHLRPDMSIHAPPFVDVDLSAIPEGKGIVVRWGGRPIFIRRRSDAEVERVRSVPLLSLIDRDARNENRPSADARDENRVRDPRWLVVVGVCTHLGCALVNDLGEGRGWLCPCHGSRYDLSGRVRKGPATTNLPVPPYHFRGDSEVRIG